MAMLSRPWSPQFTSTPSPVFGGDQIPAAVFRGLSPRNSVPCGERSAAAFRGFLSKDSADIGFSLVFEGSRNPAAPFRENFPLRDLSLADERAGLFFGVSPVPDSPSDGSNLCVGGGYVLGPKLGAGSFGEIFLGKHRITGKEVAVKLEAGNSTHQQLLQEARLYKLLAGSPGLPNVHWYGAEETYNVMVMDLLGPSLEVLLPLCGGRFSAKTVLMLAHQMITSIEALHQRHFVHRDLKPDNFLIGIGSNASQVHLIDLGLAKRFRDARTKLHVPYSEGHSLTGTARFASINAQLGFEQSRRDDLESLGHVMVYLLRGSVPWQNLSAFSKEDKYRRILERKLSVPVSDLCQQCPPEFMAYLNHCRSLRFEAEPNYDYLRRLLTSALAREHCNTDMSYDWTSLRSWPGNSFSSLLVRKRGLFAEPHVQQAPACREDERERLRVSGGLLFQTAAVR